MYRFACAAPNCRMRTYNFSKEQATLAKNNYVISFHQFPTVARKKSAWIKAAQKPGWNPPENSCLCSLHFKDDSFDQDNHLFDHAVPTIFFKDFRSFIKDLIKNINLDVDLKSDSSDDEDILRKSFKGIDPEILEDDERIEEYEIDEFEIECEEVVLSDAEVIDDLCSPASTTNPLVLTSTASSIVASKMKKSQKCNEDARKSPVTDPIQPAVSDVVNDVHNLNSALDAKKSTPQSKNASISNTTVTTKPSPVIGVKNVKTKELPATPNETAKKLFSMIQSGSFNKFSVMQPASRSLVCQLLNIVKLANAQNVQNGVDTSVPNTYIITTKQENKDSEVKKNIVLMETSEIVSMITKTVQAIKDNAFEKSENISIICGSPAIFLIKNVIVKNFDRNMNSVYVITTENLLPYLFQLSTKVNKKLDVPVIFSRSAEGSPTVSPKSSINQMSTSSCASQNSQMSPKITSSNSLATPIGRNKSQNLSTNAKASQTSSVSTENKFPVTTLKSTPRKFTYTPPRIPTLGVPNANLAVSQSSSSKPDTAVTNKAPISSVVAMRQKVASALQKHTSVSISNEAVTQLKVSSVKGSSSIAMSPHTLNRTETPTRAPSPGVGGQSALKLNLVIPKSPAPISNAPNPASPTRFANSSQSSTLRTQPLKQYPGKIPSAAPPPVFDSQPRDVQLDGDGVLKRKHEDDRNADSSAPEPKRVLDVDAYLRSQKSEIEVLEKNILQKEREILSYKKKIHLLKKRYLAVKNPCDTKSDEQLVEEILNKYLDQDAVQFLVGQMKVSGKTYTQFRWSEEDKLFALGLLYKNPVEYHTLFLKFTLPSDKTLAKFVSTVKRAEQDRK